MGSPDRSVLPAEASAGRPQPHRLHTAVQPCRLLQPRGANVLAGASWALEAPFPLYPPEPSPIAPLITLPM